MLNLVMSDMLVTEVWIAVDVNSILQVENSKLLGVRKQYCISVTY